MNWKDWDQHSAEEVIAGAIKQYGSRLAIASSFGLEDMVLIDMASKIQSGVTVFTLDTGRLHEETYELMERTRNKYDINLQVYFPDQAAVETLVREKGFFSFRDSIDNRKECCRIRKVEPLGRALSGLDAWVTGLRREQSVTRTDIAKAGEDADRPPMIKFNPLADWTEEQVNVYLKDNQVPVNALHARNYPSIGCAPCTRAITEGEDVRAGRWWWENPEHKECGLHRPK